MPRVREFTRASGASGMHALAFRSPRGMFVLYRGCKAHGRASRGIETDPKEA